jgi:hypothetical protein
MRKLTAVELRVIHEIASRLPVGERDHIISDAKSATAETISGNGARVLFTIAGYERPAYQGQHPFLIEGKVQDKDGSEIDVILHADHNNRLLELELVRYEDGEIISPDWETLSFY